MVSMAKGAPLSVCLRNRWLPASVPRVRGGTLGTKRARGGAKPTAERLPRHS